MPRSAFWQAVTHFDRSKVRPWQALRNAAGVTIPLALGALIGDPAGGLVMGTGALNVAVSDGSDPYPQRGRRLLASSLFCGLAVFAGGLLGRLHPLAILGAGVCAFAAGMMVAISTAASDIATVSLIVFVIFSAEDMSPGRALIAGSLALAGGLLQLLLSLALWPVRRYAPERQALATVYSELARTAAVRASPEEPPPASSQATNAQTALQSLIGDRSLEAERYLALLSQAERIRLALLALSRLRHRIARDPAVAAEAEKLDRALTLAGDALSAIAQSLMARSPAEMPAPPASGIRNLADQLRAHEAVSILHDARWQLEALSGQIRSALDLAGRVTPAGVSEFETREAASPPQLRLAGSLAVLRANLQWSSATFRHAVRLSVCVILGSVIGRAVSWHHSYWLPMTIAIILKPDFTSTFSRGFLRLGGTLIGLLFATALFHYSAPGLPAEIAMIAVFAYLLRCFGPANYGIFVTVLTALVVLMFALLGVAPADTMLARGLNTAAGGVIALAGYWFWPTWEQTQVAEILAKMLDYYRAYFRAVADSYLFPDRSFTAELERARLASRLARSNLEASFTRLTAEPGVAPARLTALQAILANSHRFIHAAMALEVGLVRSQSVPARPGFGILARDVDLSLYYLAASLRGSPLSLADLPDLRQDHHALVHSGDPAVERYALVNVETDRIVNSLNTVALEVFAWR